MTKRYGQARLKYRDVGFQRGWSRRATCSRSPLARADTVAEIRFFPASSAARSVLRLVSAARACVVRDPVPVLPMLTRKQLARLRASAVTPGSNRLGLAMSLMGVSQGTVAGAIGVPQPYVSDVVRGRYRTITVANARRFARYCGCRIEDLFPADAE